MTLLRGGCSLLLVLFLFSCGEDKAGPARTARRTKIAFSPDDPGSPAPAAAAAPLVFPAAPIYDFQSGVLNLTSSTPAAEEHIAINPLNSCVWLAAISDFSIRGTFNTTKYAITYDFATSWQEAFLPTNGTANGDSVVTSDGELWQANSDPVVAFDRLGNVYIAELCFNQGGSKNGIYVAKKSVGSAGPLTFTSANILPVVTNLNNPIKNDEDKEWIAVDNSTTTSTFKNRIYVSWSRFNSSGPGNSRIMVTTSSNQAASWTAPVQVSPASQDGLVQGSQVAVGPDGTVYVCWDTIVVGGHRMNFSKSTDGGVTWSAAAAITPTFTPLTDTTFTSTYRKDSFPSLAVNPVNGELYVVYPDLPTANSSIKFIRSTDGGASFSAPFTLNDVSTSQRLMPSVTADVQNNIHVCWFDTRNGADAQTLDIYALRGSVATGSLVWGASNLRITPTSFTTTQTFIGDYGGIDSSTVNDGIFTWAFAVPVWTGSPPSNRVLRAAVVASHP